MSELAIRVENLGKEYHIGGPRKTYDRLGDQLVEAVLSPLRSTKKLLKGQPLSASGSDQIIWALRNISFEIKPGEVVGIIGRNGAGKSTLLKILSRITEPNEGFADIYGRVGSLLEVGTGFHPELTGRENIYLNGAILGMMKSEIERRFDEIAAFAEIDQFLDTPVKHYSSGMYVRLAFSVAAHLEPEILLVDEVLAVGDIAFQNKCLGKMGDVAQQGRTILFVSHNMGVMQTLCQRGLLIQQGNIVVDSSISDAVDAYMQTLEQVGSQDLAKRTDRQGRGMVRLTSIEMFDENDTKSTTLTAGGRARFVFHVDGMIGGISCVFTIFNQLGQRLVAFVSNMPGQDDVYDPGIGQKFICDINELLLVPGRYRINVLIRGGGEWQDYLEAAASFDVRQGYIGGRLVKPYREISVSMPHRWMVPIQV